MFPEERRAKILDILRQTGRCRVAELAAQLDTSEVTVRQDLDTLEKLALLSRTHGGAILKPKASFERPFQIVESVSRQEKERIGKAAADLIADGETIILDVGTTVAEVARNLHTKKDLTVLTNALNIAAILEDYPGITVMVTGGTLRAKQHSLVNPYAGFVLDRLNVDTAFIGINGISAEHSLTNVNIAEAEMKTLFIQKAQRSIVLADSSKVGNIALAKVADISEIDMLITDKRAKSSEIAQLEEKGLTVKQV